MSDPLSEIEAALHPYDLPVHDRLPDAGRPRTEVLAEVEEMARAERGRWEDGYASGAVYHGDAGHVEFLAEVYAAHSQSNPLHVDLWPSAVKFESEIVSMTRDMLNGGEEVVGTVTSGGTESIVLAIKAYRDHTGRSKIVAPETAHAAFDKGAQLLAMELVKVPVGDDLRADVDAIAAAIDDDTALVAGSAPGFPHGVIDPIEALSEAARERGVGFHADTCLGGFMLPFAEQLGYDVPPFDFRLPGVTSMSCDTHKYGYAAKGTSVVLYRGADLRHSQYFTVTDWPGGMYMSPTIAGSRPGALSAACWAAMVTTGRDGYLDAARRILEAATRLKEGIAAIDGIHVLGDPLFDVAFAADVPAPAEPAAGGAAPTQAAPLDVYRVLDEMSARGWSLNGLHRPPALHVCTTLRHTEPGVVDRLLADLAAAVEEARAHPEAEGGMAPVYGMAATLPDRSIVSDVLKTYMDLWYKI